MEPDVFPLDEEEARVLGCLIEKAMTTPDHYPMSLNGVRVACNQVSNRNPIVDFDETTVAETLRRLADRGLAKMVHRPGDRVVKYKHAADQVLELAPQQIALFAVLLLRGLQTPGELRQRTSRYVEFTGLPEVEMTLDALRRLDLVAELPRRPGQKENRWRDVVRSTENAAVPEDTDDVYTDEPPPEVTSSDRPAPGPVADRAVSADLERRVTVLERRLGALLDALDVSDI